MPDRIEIIYKAIDQMTDVHGTPRPEHFGGGIWDFDEEVEIWRKQVTRREHRSSRGPLTPLQWSIIDRYIQGKRTEVYGDG